MNKFKTSISLMLKVLPFCPVNIELSFLSLYSETHGLFLKFSEIKINHLGLNDKKNRQPKVGPLFKLWSNNINWSSIFFGGILLILVKINKQ